MLDGTQSSPRSFVFPTMRMRVKGSRPYDTSSRLRLRRTTPTSRSRGSSVSTEETASRQKVTKQEKPKPDYSRMSDFEDIRRKLFLQRHPGYPHGGSSGLVRINEGLATQGDSPVMSSKFIEIPPTPKRRRVIPRCKTPPSDYEGEFPVMSFGEPPPNDVGPSKGETPRMTSLRGRTIKPPPTPNKGGGVRRFVHRHSSMGSFIKRVIESGVYE
uniref:Uncharacterized protein n=1 Tax=Ciona intestinalis TaxID=7719 RepID=F6PI23_CIOIN